MFRKPEIKMSDAEKKAKEEKDRRDDADRDARRKRENDARAKVASAAYAKQMNDSRARRKEELLAKIERRKEAVRDGEKELAKWSSNGNTPHTVERLRKELETKKRGLKKLEGQLKNVDKIFDFCIKHEPANYGLSAGDYLCDEFEKIVEKYNPGADDEQIDGAVNDFRSEVSDFVELEMPYYSYRRDIHEDEKIPMEKIPEHPWKGDKKHMLKSLTERVEKALSDHGLHVPASAYRELLERAIRG